MVKGFFTSVLEAPALNMGVFVGDYCWFCRCDGFTTNITIIGNYQMRYHFLMVNGLSHLSLFCGQIIVSVALALIWPNIQAGINNFGLWIAQSQDSAPILAPFLYGTLERLLSTFWVTSYVDDSINYTQLGGTYEILSGAQAGTQVFGQDPLWLAWATDLVNPKGAGDMSKYQFVLEIGHQLDSKVGQMIGSSGIF